MKLDTSQHRPRLSASVLRSLNGGGAILLSALNTLDSRRRIGLSAMFGIVCVFGLLDAIHLDSRILAAWIADVICFIGLVLPMCVNIGSGLLEKG